MSFTKGTAALDLGCRHTKLALGFRKDNGEHQLSSVPFDGVRNDPDYPDTNDEFEFMAYAGLTPNRQWVEGRAALSCDTQVPVKTLLVWVAGIRRTAIIDRIPGGRLTRELFHDELITIDEARAILLRHLRRMATMMLLHANRQRVNVVRIVLLYPSYLWPAEGEDDFDRYIDCYRGLMRACLSHSIEFYPVNEGLASILYMSEPFVDSISGSTKALLPNLFSDMYTANWAYLLYVDWGSSTMNVQVVKAFFKDGTITHTSPVEFGYPPGVVSGSDIANDDVRSLIQRDLARLSQAGLAGFREGTLARYCQVFERQKRRIDYSEYTIRNRTLYLHDDEDDGADIRIDLPAKELARIFEHAYNPGLTLLQRVIHRILTSGIDFTVIFSGGSVMNHGLRKKLESIMDRYERHAAVKGVELRTVFMSDLQKRWSTTNACGAAGAFDRAPSLASIVHNMNIGVQRVDIDLKSVGTSRRYRYPSDRAPLLFSMSHDWQRRVVLPGCIQDDWAMQLNLICDPSYHTGHQVSSEIAPSIPISTKYNEDITTSYDLGCLVSTPHAQDYVGVALGGRRLRCLMAGEQDSALKDNLLPVVLSIYACNVAGRKLHKPHDTKYVLWLRPDPATRQAVVSQEYDFAKLAVPYWCSSCARENDGVVGVCRECEHYGLCRTCAQQSKPKHEHRLRFLDLDPQELTDPDELLM